ncbi:transmembrane protein 121B [Hemibagrus wyckioides]|nr:transmembrane protein 121B [Hemibagrus wyckioides]
MIADIRKANSVASCVRAEAAIYPDSPVSSAPENGQLLLRSGACTRGTSTSASSANADRGSTDSASAAARAMTSGCEFPPSAPPFVPRSAKNLFYKVLCFALLVLQGGILDFYLIAFTDLYWCSWIATDLVVVSGWAIFFVRNARSKRERACGFRQKSSLFGCHLGEFAFAHLAWLVYVIACAPKVALVLQTSILELVAREVPLGAAGFEATALLAAPLLFCLINSLVEDPHGAPRYHSQSCFVNTCVDVLDSFTLVDLLLVQNEIPNNAYLKYGVMAAYFVALVVPVLWLYELSAASRMRCRWMCARFLSGVLLDAPLLAVRCLLVLLYDMPVSLFMFKNVFFLACKCLELVEQCASLRSVRRLARGGDPAQFSHCVSENDMCPRGYVNTLAVNTQP